MTVTAPKFYTNLELLRFFAAFAVMVSHFRHFEIDIDVAFSPFSYPFAAALAPLYMYGAYAVPFFWLLSGFVFFAQYEKALRTRTVSGARFAGLRFARLYPLHITTALLVFFVQPVYAAVSGSGKSFIYQDNALEDLFLHTLMVSHFDPRSPQSLNGPVWSVSLEILVYITFFLIMRFSPRPYLTSLVLALLVVPASMTSRNDILTVVSLFYIGGFIYLFASRVYPTWNRFRRQVSLAGAIALIAVQVVGVITQPHVTFPRMALLFITIVTVAALLPQVRGRAGRVFGHLGNTTYSSYLVHFPLQLVAVTVMAAFGVVPDATSPALLISYVVVVYAVSVVVYRYFEKPAMDKIRAKLPA